MKGSAPITGDTPGSRWAAWAVLCAVLGVSWGCAGPIRGLYPPGEGEPIRSVYVVSHGWHAGIVVSRQDVPEGFWPEHNDFPGADYLEVGWGDRDFYQAVEPTSGLALKAAFWPSASVLHVAGFRGPVERLLRGAESVEIGLSLRGFQALTTFIQDAYARNESDQAIPVGPGQSSQSRFYLARETYFLLRTCNTWVARALRAAGCPVTPLYAVTAGNVMYQARRCRAAGSGSGRDGGLP